MRSSSATFIATMPFWRPDASANSDERGALHAARRGHEHEVRVVLVQPGVEHRDDLLAVAELEQVLRGGEPLLRQLVHRRAVRAARGR